MDHQFQQLVPRGKSFHSHNHPRSRDRIHQWRPAPILPRRQNPLNWVGRALRCAPGRGSPQPQTLATTERLPTREPSWPRRSLRFHPGKSSSCFPPGRLNAFVDKFGDPSTIPALRRATSNIFSICSAKIPLPVIRVPNSAS
jgi:hypothetical protein